MIKPKARRNDEQETTPIDTEAQQRELDEAGWEAVTRMGKLVWRHPESGHLYPQGQAIRRLRMDRASEEEG